MNRGMHPVEVAKSIKLPPSLRDNPWLQSFYGTPEWSSRAIFDAYIGWFSGNPEELFPLAPTERGTRMVKSFGFEKVNKNGMEFLSNYCCWCKLPWSNSVESNPYIFFLLFMHAYFDHQSYLPISTLTKNCLLCGSVCSSVGGN